jgi:hypothetical protein
MKFQPLYNSYIMSHVCGVAVKTSTLKILTNVENMARQGILVFY